MNRRRFLASAVSVPVCLLAAKLEASEKRPAAECRLCQGGYQLVRGSFVDELVHCVCGRVHYVAKQYVPKEGDLVFFNSGGPIKQALWAITLSGGGYVLPTHVGIIVKDANGVASLLQAMDPDPMGTVARREGVEPGRVCMTSNVVSYLSHYPGKVWVRPYRRNLCPNHSAALTAWAIRQVGKPYAVEKLAHPTLGLPVQTMHFFGPAHTDASSWHCSGLVSAALVMMAHYGRWDLRPASTDPEDLFSDVILDLSPAWKPPVRWGSLAHHAGPRRG